jgi:molybdenum cofactor sulfurtransferase
LVGRAPFERFLSGHPDYASTVARDELRRLEYHRLEELADEQRISLRTGCFCNPGAGEIAEDLTEDDIRAGLAEGDEISLSRFAMVRQARGDKSAGPLRVSFGLVSNLADVERYVAFAVGLREQISIMLRAVSFDIEN